MIFTFLTLHSSSQSSLRGQTFSKPPYKVFTRPISKSSSNGGKTSITDILFLRLFDTMGSLLHCHSALPPCCWYLSRNDPKRDYSKKPWSFVSLCAESHSFPRRTSKKGSNSYAASCQVRYCITWGQWLLWISYHDFTTQDSTTDFYILIILRDIWYCSNNEGFIHSWIFKFLWQTYFATWY